MTTETMTTAQEWQKDTGVNVKRLNAKVPRLMGATEVAATLGVARTNLNKVVGMPDPVFTLARGQVWRADVVEAFAAWRAARNGPPA